MSVTRPPEERRKYILHHLGEKNANEIAEDMGVHVRTIYRDIDTLREDGIYWDWAKEEFLRLHREGEISDETKYKELNKIQLKEFTEKHSVETKGDISIVVKFNPMMENGDTDKLPTT